MSCAIGKLIPIVQTTKCVCNHFVGDRDRGGGDSPKIRGGCRASSPLPLAFGML